MGGFNTSVAQPSPVALDIKPPVSQSPMEIAAGMQAMRAQQQQMQTQQLQQQEMQLNLAQRKAVNDAYSQAFTPQADGSVQLDDTKLTSALATAGHGEAIPGIMENLTKYRQSLSSLQETNQKVAAAESDAAGNLAATVKAANNDPTLFHTLLTDAINRKLIQPSHYGPLDQMLQQSLQQDPTGEQARGLVGKFTDQMIAGSPKQQELANSRMSARGSAQRGAAAQQQADRASQENARKDAASNLATAVSADEYTAKLNALPHGIATLFPAGGQVFDSTGKPTEEGLQRVRFVGMTPNEQNAAVKPPKESNPTEASLAMAVSDPTKSPEERDAADAALKRLDKSKIAARPVIQTVIPGLGGQGSAGQQQLSGEDYLRTLPAATANQIRGISEGRLTMPSASTRSQGALALRNAVMQYDPAFSEQKAQVRKAFTTGPDGKNIGALNTATVHLDQLGEISKAMSNGSFRPGNAVWNAAVTMFGGAAPTNFEGLKSAVSGELANALKGNATDQEIHNIAASIDKQNSPQQLAGYLDTQLHVLGAKLNTYNQRYQQQIPGDKAYNPILPAARAVFQKHGFDPTGETRTVSASLVHQYAVEHSMNDAAARKAFSDKGYTVQ